jgi:hypothetical protein
MSWRTDVPYHRINPDPEYHNRCVTPVKRRVPLVPDKWGGGGGGLYVIGETLPEAPCRGWIVWVGPEEHGHYRHLPHTFWEG